MFKFAIKNRFIGFGILGISMGSCSTMVEQNNDMVLYNAKNNNIKWRNKDLRDRVFYSAMVLSAGGLIILETGVLIWAVPGATMLGVAFLSNLISEKDLSAFKHN